MVELWTERTSGVLRAEPLLLRACEAGAFGKKETYPGGGIYKALFTYLCGEVNAELFAARRDLCEDSWIVCMSEAWESFLRRQPLSAVYRRCMMVPRRAPSVKKVRPLPEDCRLSGFTPEIFAAHPFGHGANYRDFEEFSARGAGAAVCCPGGIASSASSFLTFADEVELDVSTLPERRGQGLADACVKAMLDACAERGLTVHWDAQNRPSAEMAKSHGFVPEQAFAAYVLKADFPPKEKAARPASSGR